MLSLAVRATASVSAISPAQRRCPCIVGDQVVADLEQQMRHAAALAMDRDRVVGQVVDEVGLVVRSMHPGLRGSEGGEEKHGEAAVAVGQGAGVPRPFRPAGQPRREAVDGDEDRRRPLVRRARRATRERAMERLVDLLEALSALPLGEPLVARHWRAVAHRRRSSPAPRTGGCSRPPGGCSAAAPAAHRAARRADATGLRRRRPRRCAASMSAGPTPRSPSVPGSRGRHARSTARRASAPARIDRLDRPRVAERQHRRLGFARLKHRWPGAPGAAGRRSRPPYSSEGKFSLIVNGDISV